MRREARDTVKSLLIGGGCIHQFFCRTRRSISAAARHIRRTTFAKQSSNNPQGVS